MKRKNLPRRFRIVRSKDGINWEKTNNTYSRDSAAVQRIIEFNKSGNGWRYKVVPYK